MKNKDAPGYFDAVKDPIDLSVMKGKAKRRAYTNLDDLRSDFKQMIRNSVIYNGMKHDVTTFAETLLSVAEKEI